MPARDAGRSGSRLLQLDFLVFHMLARLRVELHDRHLLGRGLLVLAGGVEVAGAGGRLQLDLLACAFGCHDESPLGFQAWPRARMSASTASMPFLSISRRPETHEEIHHGNQR